MRRNWLKYILIPFLVLAPILQLKAQNKPDSLLQLANSEVPEKMYAAQMDLAEFYQKKDSAKAEEYASRVFERPEELSDSLLHDLMVRMVVFYTNYYNHKKAVEKAKKILPIAKNRNDTFLLAETHKRISASYYMMFEYDSTSNHLKKASLFYNHLGDQSNVGLMIMREGGVHYSKGEYPEAMRKAFRASEIFKEIDQNLQLAHAYMQLGNIYYFLQANEEASTYYQLSSEYYLSMEDTMGWAFSHSNLGLAKIEQDSFKLGLQIQREALPTIKKSGRQASIGNTYHYMGVCLIGLNQLDSAERYIKMALKNNKSSKYIPGIAYDYKELGQIALKRNKIDSAIYFGKKALMIIDTIKNYEAEKEINLFLAECYEISGQKTEAYDYLKRYHDLIDSADFNEKDIERMAFDQQSKLDRAHYELKLSHQRELIKEKENQNQQLLIIVLSIIAIISIFFAAIISSTNRKNKYLNKELKNKQDLLEAELNTKRALLKEVHHRVKNNLQIISSMLSIQTQYNEDEPLENIIRESRNRIMSMSLIHESLYKREEAEDALFSSYVKELIPQLIETYHVDESKVHLYMKINDLELSLDDSVPCGLIINEIISNSLKHAFPNGKEGNISIEMYKDEEGMIHLKIEDDGVGFPDGVLPKNQDTFGFLLLYSLVDQLEANIEVGNHEGVSFHIFWKPKDDKLLD
ncbi:MAG: histidine kinase dimerization/phosphoacceptor domain -containing protein [Vicingaceae bacterium]